MGRALRASESQEEDPTMRHDIDNEEDLGLLFDKGGLVPSVCWALLLAAAALSTLMDPGVPSHQLRDGSTTTAQVAPQPR
jgi:hypothetical protein